MNQTIITPASIPAARSVTDIVDELGRLKAKLAPLSEQEKALKEELIAAAGHASAKFDGKLFHAAVSVFDQDRIDNKAVLTKLAELMRPSDFTKFLKKVTKPSTVEKVLITARIQAE